jgi:hypothetical protein
MRLRGTERGREALLADNNNFLPSTGASMATEADERSLSHLEQIPVDFTHSLHA